MARFHLFCAATGTGESFRRQALLLFPIVRYIPIRASRTILEFAPIVPIFVYLRHFTQPATLILHLFGLVLGLSVCVLPSLSSLPCVIPSVWSIYLCLSPVPPPPP